jgi:hypothetical protein
LVRLWTEESAAGDIVGAFIKIMRAQQEWDGRQALSDRSGIGGENILALSMECQTLWTCYQFEDLATMYELARENEQLD